MNTLLPIPLPLALSNTLLAASTCPCRPNNEMVADAIRPYSAALPNLPDPATCTGRQVAEGCEGMDGSQWAVAVAFSLTSCLSTSQWKSARALCHSPWFPNSLITNATSSMAPPPDCQNWSTHRAN